MQEDYIKEEQRNLKRELLRALEEVKRIQAVPLVIGQFMEAVDATSGIIGSTAGSNYYVRLSSFVRSPATSAIVVRIADGIARAINDTFVNTALLFCVSACAGGRYVVRESARQPSVRATSAA